ncbi:MULTISPECIES: hypothetical protein [unclassified Mesorhizobium]|nr:MULTISPECIES: hypothetical protein [unclassified Mesorhizobium]
MKRLWGPLLMGLAIITVCSGLTYADYASSGAIFGPMEHGE